MVCNFVRCLAPNRRRNYVWIGSRFRASFGKGMVASLLVLSSDRLLQQQQACLSYALTLRFLQLSQALYVRLRFLKRSLFAAKVIIVDMIIVPALPSAERQIHAV